MNTREEKTYRYAVRFLILLELFILLFFLFFLVDIGTAQVGNNVTTRTNLSVGNSAPDILNITIFDSTNGIDLIINATREVTVQAIIRDYNGETDIANTTMEFYSAFTSFFGDADDNNEHYTNVTCTLDTSYGDSMEANATCRFDIWYYADNSTWNVSVLAFDQFALGDYDIRQTTVNTLLGLGLPDEVNYGLVNATNVSNERQMNVTNYGNVRINLTVEGYARNRSDGYAMNCSLGALQNISIGYEKYNFTASNLSVINLTQFQTQYLNLTNTTVIKSFGLNQRFNDTLNEATNATYWRIYVPLGVAGSCNGNIIMGATRATGT